MYESAIISIDIGLLIAQIFNVCRPCYTASFLNHNVFYLRSPACKSVSQRICFRECKWDEPVPMPLPNLLAAPLTSISCLIVLQVLSRMFTFLLNQALVRLTTLWAFRTATMQSALLLSITHFSSPAKVGTLLCFANGKQHHPILSTTYCFSQ